jgi:hypothetical protein
MFAADSRSISPAKPEVVQLTFLKRVVCRGGRTPPRRRIPTVGQGAWLPLRPGLGSMHACFIPISGPKLRLVQPKVPNSGHFEHTKVPGAAPASVTRMESSATRSFIGHSQGRKYLPRLSRECHNCGKPANCRGVGCRLDLAQVVTSVVAWQTGALPEFVASVSDAPPHGLTGCPDGLQSIEQG